MKKKVFGWTQFAVGCLGLPICVWLAIYLIPEVSALHGLWLLACIVGCVFMIKDGWKVSYPKEEKVD